jgi:hypothetical protein
MFFKRKKQYEDENRGLRDVIGGLENRLVQAHTDAEQAQTSLMMDIREMDQLVYQMGQCSSWPIMQPYFAKLQALCSRRQNAESDRVRAILVPEIRKVYLQPSRRTIGDT